MSKRSGKTASAPSRLAKTRLHSPAASTAIRPSRLGSHGIAATIIGPLGRGWHSVQSSSKADAIWMNGQPHTYNSQPASRPVFVRILARWYTRENRMEGSGPKDRVMLGHRSMRRCCAVGCCLVQFILRSSVDSGLHECTYLLLLNPRHSRLPSPRVHTRSSRNQAAAAAHLAPGLLLPFGINFSLPLGLLVERSPTRVCISCAFSDGSLLLAC